MCVGPAQKYHSVIDKKPHAFVYNQEQSNGSRVLDGFKSLSISCAAAWAVSIGPSLEIPSFPAGFIEPLYLL